MPSLVGEPSCTGQQDQDTARGEDGEQLPWTGGVFFLGSRWLTPVWLTSRTAIKLDHGYRLVLPVAAYQSWKGMRIEGKGIEPDVVVDWSFDAATAGQDNQFEYALRVVQSL